MKRLSGFVFDSYDDAEGKVLREVFGDPSQLPYAVKTASRLTSDQIEELSDDQFALILFDGTDKFKKYATIDEGHTILSITYLLKQAHLLPLEAVKTAAQNLIGACEMFGIDIPSQLKVAALTGMSPVSGKAQSPYARNAKVNKLNWPIKEPAKESHDNPELGRADAAWDDVKDRVNPETPGSNFMEIPVFSPKEKEKTAGAFGNSPGDVITKQKSWREVAYFDMTGWDPTMAIQDEPTPATLTLVDGHYPVDSYDQVKTASAYFTENWTGMDPRTRHQYCVKLAQRMDDLKIPVSDEIRRYGSDSYAADVDSYVEARRPYIHEEYNEGLDLLLEKRAHVSPSVFAETLAEFDKISGLNWHWGGKIADPWWSTFGPEMSKLAEDWRYDHTGTRIREEDLERLARNGHQRLVHSFGADFAKEFSKNPKAVFNSLPEPNKLVLARLASDQHSGTYTE
jgi:hypothetical protein